MKNVWLALGLAAVLAGCSTREALDIPEGSDVTIEKSDGVAVSGRLVEVKKEQVVVEGRDGMRTRVPRGQIASMRAVSPAAPHALPKNASPATGEAVAANPGTPPTDAGARDAAPLRDSADAPATASARDAAGSREAAARLQPADAPPTVEAADTRATSGTADADQRRGAGAASRTREYREITIPAGTTLAVALTSAVGSDTSRLEDQVRGKLQRGVHVGGAEALPAGSALVGHVTGAHPSGKVKGRASIAFRFNTIDLPGEGGREKISTATYSRVAPATKKKDATKIGVGAGAGAVIGGLLGGGSGAAKGAAIGGGAGTAAVLATKGDEVHLPAGTPVTIRLTAPLTVRVPR